MHATMSNFCTTCGSPFEPSQKFCTICGAEIKYSRAEASQHQSQNCPSCGVVIIPKAKFCIKCGHEITGSASHQSYKQGLCPNCGTFVTSSAKFCIKCGTEFGKEMSIQPVEIPIEEEAYSVSVSDEPMLENMAAENLCNACGIPLTPNANFCTKCGAKIGQSSNLKQNIFKGEKWTQATKKVSDVLEQTLDASDFPGEMCIPMDGAQKSMLSSISKVIKKTVLFLIFFFQPFSLFGYRLDYPIFHLERYPSTQYDIKLKNFCQIILDDELEHYLECDLYIQKKGENYSTRYKACVAIKKTKEMRKWHRESESISKYVEDDPISRLFGFRYLIYESYEEALHHIYLSSKTIDLHKENVAEGETLSGRERVAPNVQCDTLLTSGYDTNWSIERAQRNGGTLFVISSSTIWDVDGSNVKCSGDRFYGSEYYLILCPKRLRGAAVLICSRVSLNYFSPNGSSRELRGEWAKLTSLAEKVIDYDDFDFEIRADLKNGEVAEGLDALVESIEVMDDASEEAGETGTKIPPGLVVGIGAALGAAAFVKINKKRKKKLEAEKQRSEQKENKSKRKEKQQEEEEEEKNTYEMRIRKDFKSTLYIGVPVSVYARIVEIDSKGKERDVPELTSCIYISSNDGLEVSRNEMVGGYKKAEILVQLQENPPPSATIDFRLTSGMLSFTNHVRFNIGSWGIKFFQDNLTLSNGHSDTEYLPVFVYGIEDPDVSVEIDSDDYEISIAEDKTQTVPGEKTGKHPEGTLFHVAITEKIPQEEKEKKKLKPGEVAPYTLKFVACHNEHQIQETIPLYRIGLGLMFDLSAVNCYMDEKSGAVPHTQAHCMVLYWDKENNTVGRGIPHITNFIVLPREMKAPDEESMVSKALGTILATSAQWQNLVNNIYGYEEEVSQKEIDLKYEQYLVQKLNIGLEVPQGAKLDPELGLECEVFPQNCALDAPQRFQVTATLYAKFQGEDYVCCKESVELRSQPKRLFMNIDASFEADKQDERIKQTLLNIRDAVTHYADLPVNADAMVKLIDLSIKYYSPLYGYDRRVIKTIQKAYTGMLGYHQAEAFAELDEVESRDKDFLGNLMIIAREGTEIEDSIGIGKRIMLGVCTLGMSEHVFTGCRVLTNMQDAVMSGSGFWMSYLMGCVPVVSDFAFSKIFEYGGEAFKKVKNMPSVKRATEGVKKFFTSGTDDIAVKALNGRVGLDYAEGMSKLANDAKKAAMEGEKAIAKGIKSESDEAWELGMKLARERIGKMRELLRNGQRGSKELQDVVMSIQMDKYAMNILKRMPKDSFDAVNLRMVFNEVMETQNKKVIDSTLQSLADMFGQPVKNFDIYRASATKKIPLMFGETVTFDLDVTYHFISKDGSVIKIPQQIAENLHNIQLYKTWFGEANPTLQMVNNFARAMDHSVVQLASKENYGTEQILKKIIDPAHWGNKMTTAEASRAADTIAYKGIHWLNASKESLKKASESTSLMEKLLHVKDAMINEAEAMRQIVKQAEYMAGKNAVVVGAGGPNSIPFSLQVCWAVMKKVTQGSMDPNTAKTYIQKTLGYSLKDVCEKTGKVLIEINKRL